jgi:hypothetical protein
MTQGTNAEEKLRAFVEFSAAVTGFSEFDLWGTGQAEVYYRTAVEQEGPDAIEKAMASDPSATPADPVVGSIVKLWYVGVWYGPQLAGRMDVAAWTAPGRSGAKPAVPDGSEPAEEREPLFVVSPDAYTEGLLWRAIGAHPSGAKAPGYGSWATPPTFEDRPEEKV